MYKKILSYWVKAFQPPPLPHHYPGSVNAHLPVLASVCDHASKTQK